MKKCGKLSLNIIFHNKQCQILYGKRHQNEILQLPHVQSLHIELQISHNRLCTGQFSESNLTPIIIQWSRQPFFSSDTGDVRENPHEIATKIIIRIKHDFLFRLRFQHLPSEMRDGKRRKHIKKAIINLSTH